MANSEFKISLNKIIEQFKLEMVYESSTIDKVYISSSDLNRPGLQMVGFFDYFDSSRLQVLGKVECTYLEQFKSEQRAEMLDRFFSHEFPAIIITRDIRAFPELLAAAEKYDRTVLRTEMETSSFMSALISYLNVEIAPRRTRHGVLVEVYGEGILIMGESGVGKSETAIELLKRGHRLVADDAVEIKRVSEKTLVGTSPDRQYCMGDCVRR